MRARIGLSIHADAVRTVMVRDGAVLWRSESPRSDDVTLEETVRLLLAGAPRKRFGLAPHVVAALGAAASCVKQVEGIPQTADRRTASSVVRENARTFFMRVGTVVEIPEVERRGEGWWAAALDGRVVQAVVRACAANGLHLVGTVPAVAVLGAAVIHGQVRWRDGSVAIEATYAGGACTQVRPLRSDSVVESPALPGAKALGAAAEEFAAAYSAATFAHSLPFAVDSLKPARDKRLRRVLRAGLAAMIVLGVATATAGPPLLLRWRAAQMRAEVESLRSAVRADLAAESAARRQLEALRRVRSFREKSHSMTALLGTLSMALPDSTAILTLRVDSIGGSIVTVAPMGTTVLTHLARVPGIKSPRLVGALTREVVGGVQLQRSAMAFQLKAAQ
jgi:hypothetical protein